MKKTKSRTFGFVKYKGQLDISYTEQDDFEGKKEEWNTVMISGDPDGLRFLSSLSLKLADINQEKLDDVPVGSREHESLRVNIELSKSSARVIVGRLDAKGTGEFCERYIPREMSNKNS